METQGYPNACNVPSFESMTLEKDKNIRRKPNINSVWKNKSRLKKSCKIETIEKIN